MAILNSITIGKGRKSLGNVTLQTLGGVVVAKQKIMRNTSKTQKQQAQRKHFKEVMNQLRKFAGVARAAYPRVKTQSAYARWAKSFYPTAAGLSRAELGISTPVSLTLARIDAGDDFMISEGKKVFSGAAVAEAGTENEQIVFELTAGLPGAVPFSVGDTIPVEVQAWVPEISGMQTLAKQVTVGSAPGAVTEQAAVWLAGGVLYFRLIGAWSEGALQIYPVISINNERIGLPASLLALGA